MGEIWVLSGSYLLNLLGTIRLRFLFGMRPKGKASSSKGYNTVGRGVVSLGIANFK
jgi:hypothetical protein